MRKGYGVSILLVLLGLVFLAAAATRLQPINAQRVRDKMEPMVATDDLRLASELRLPTVALSLFRSLAIDYLWIRADNLKMEGQYFDAQHLARLICELQPNLATVWDFQAWNMAYNISVAMPTAPERWNWVWAGIELLRDKGLKYNPKNMALYYSLAWTFWHKMGGYSDDQNRYYKKRLAYEIGPFLTPLLTPIWQSCTQEDLINLAESEQNWNQLIKDQDFADLVGKIKQAEPKFDSDQAMFDGLVDMRIHARDYSEDLYPVLQQNLETEAFDKLDLFVRARLLRERWKLNPQRMVDLNNKYGPINYKQQGKRESLDWRMPEVHAIYWADRALQYAEPGKRDTVYLKLNRLIYHGLQNLFHYGRLQVIGLNVPQKATPREAGQEIPDTPERYQLELFNTQDLRMFPIAYQATVDLLRNYEEAGEDKPGGVRDGSINLLRDGITNFWLTGQTELARRYYRELKNRYPTSQRKWPSLTLFVKNQIKSEAESFGPKKASDYINSMLREHWGRLAVGDDENAAIKEAWARQIHQIVEEDFSAETDPTNRIRLMEYPKLYYISLQDFFDDQFVISDIKYTLLSRLKISQPALFERVMKYLRKKSSESKAPNPK